MGVELTMYIQYIYYVYMTSTIIVKTDSKLKAKAQKTAAELGLTLSTVINNHLKRFVEEKSVFFQKYHKKKKFTDPYGMFKGAKITNKDIEEVENSWMKVLDEI